MLLLQFTLAVNFIALAAALWLGLYVVTRSPRSPIAWLTGLTLWSVAGLFLNILLALNSPPIPADVPDWARLLLPFWPVGVFERGWGSWLQGWLVTPAVVLWHHVTMLMRPGPMNWWRWTRVIFGYGVAASAVVVQLYTPFMFASAVGDPLYLNALKPGPLLPYFLVVLSAFIGLSLINLVRSARAAPTAMPRKQLILLAAATLVAGLTAPVTLVAATLGIDVPRVTLSLLLGCTVILIGYGVARYSALVEGRVIGRDFVYNAVAVGLVTSLYMAVTWLSVHLYQVPPAAFIFVLMLAIVTHSLVDVARRALDSLFYRRDVGRLRANLRRMAGLVGELASPDEKLSLVLNTMCASVDATFGVLVLFEGEGLRLAAAYRWRPDNSMPLSPKDLGADDVLRLSPGTLPTPLSETTLLIPLYAEDKQLGALLLGRPVNGISYSQSDIDLLLDPTDRLTDAIVDAQREAEHLAQVAHLAESRPPRRSGSVGHLLAKDVEDALHNITAFAYLGDHPLASLRSVTFRLPAHGVTHVDRGKAVHKALAEAIEKLRPEGNRPGDPPPREWYPYAILHDAYLEDMPNRDIMARLYISEGTFNRTRRAALRAVTRMMEEMETALG